MRTLGLVAGVLLVMSCVLATAQDEPEPEGTSGSGRPAASAKGAAGGAKGSERRVEELEEEALRALRGEGVSEPTETRGAPSGARGATGPTKATGKAASKGSAATREAAKRPTGTAGATATRRGGTSRTARGPADANVPELRPGPGEELPDTEGSPLTPRRRPAPAETVPVPETDMAPLGGQTGTLGAPTGGETGPITPGSVAPPVDEYRTPPPTDTAPPLEMANALAPATTPPSARSPASAIIIGLVVLAVLFVALAAVVGVMAAQRSRAVDTPVLQPPQTEWAYLSAPNAPNISLQKTPFLMGSSPSSDLRLADPKCSPQHARIDRTEDGYVLTDLNSTNGTFLNGERIASPVSLRPGDEIRMGDIVVTFEIYEA